MFGTKHKAPTPRNFQMEIDDHAQAVKLLLFIRSAWSLEEGTADVPALDPVPSPGNSTLPDTANRDVWVQRWNHEWQRIWDWYGSKQNKAVSPTPGQSDPEHDSIPPIPPFWNTEFGTAGVDMDAFLEWDRQTLPDVPPQPESSENMSALTAAWERGIAGIIVLPYEGHFASLINPRQLVISAHTKNIPKNFRAALIE